MAKAKSKKPKQSEQLGRGWKGLKPHDLVNFDQELAIKFRHTLHDFQREAIRAQLHRKDVLVHAGTGSGKTTIAAGPHVHAKTKGMVTFMVSPLIALQEEQVTTFRDEFGLAAVAVNTSHGGCTIEIMVKICKGTWQIILISPEILLSKKFVKNVLRNPEMAPRILSIVVDEAHVISHWGSGFRKSYASLGILWALIPKGIPFVAMSATLAPRVRKDILSKLQFHKDDYIDLNVGNDRPNVSIVVRAIHNPMNTYSDLDFLVPDNVQCPEDIKKTFLYIDQISAQVDIEERLYSQLPASYRDQGVIRPYSAAFTAKHRVEVLDLFKAGYIRILICTDAAGMGCNIRDVDIVVQWKLPTSVSTFVQRAGRAGRGSGRSGLAVLLVEKSVYDADLSRLHEANTPVKKKSVRQSSSYPKATKQYASDHGVLRGSYDGQYDKRISTEEVPIDSKSPDEGLYTLVQTGFCRRKVWTTVYRNKIPHPSVSCCDLCDPSLLDLTRPGPPPVVQRAPHIKMGMPNEIVRTKLEDWRERVWKRDFEGALFAPSGILNDKIVENLASVGPVLRLIELERVVGAQWPWLGQYGDDLLTELVGMSIPPITPKPTQGKSTKRPRDAAAATVAESTMQRNDQRGPKRRRVVAKHANAGENSKAPTPVKTTSASAVPLSTHPPASSPPPVTTIPRPSSSGAAQQAQIHQYPPGLATPNPYYNAFHFPPTPLAHIPPYYGYGYGYYPQTPVAMPAFHHQLLSPAQQNPSGSQNSTTPYYGPHPSIK